MLDLTGHRFKRLTVLEKTNRRDQKSIVWKCKCLCGKIVDLPARDLVHGNRKGCGMCADTKHELYSTWRGMIQRCENLLDKDYGGRGIKVCNRWKNEFLYFLEDMGDKPSKEYSIERIDVDGNYEPSNCKWALADEQAINQRSRGKLNKEDFISIYLSDLSQIELSKKYNLDLKSIKNIQCLAYGDNCLVIIGTHFNLLDPRDRKAIKFAKLKYRLCNKGNKL